MNVQVEFYIPTLEEVATWQWVTGLVVIWYLFVWLIIRLTPQRNFDLNGYIDSNERSRDVYEKIDPRLYKIVAWIFSPIVVVVLLAILIVRGGGKLGMRILFGQHCDTAKEAAKDAPHS